MLYCQSKSALFFNCVSCVRTLAVILVVRYVSTEKIKSQLRGLLLNYASFVLKRDPYNVPSNSRNHFRNSNWTLGWNSNAQPSQETASLRVVLHYAASLLWNSQRLIFICFMHSEHSRSRDLKRKEKRNKAVRFNRLAKSLRQSWHSDNLWETTLSSTRRFCSIRLRFFKRTGDISQRVFKQSARRSSRPFD